MRKGRIKSPCLVRVYLLNLLSFYEGKTRFTHAIAASKRANSQLAHTRLQPTTTYFFSKTYTKIQIKNNFSLLMSVYAVFF